MSNNIDENMVARIAKLSRLELSKEKIAEYTPQLVNILAYMDTLSVVDTENVEPLYSPVDESTFLREDIVAKDYSREEILSNAPEKEGEFFVVPRIV